MEPSGRRWIVDGIDGTRFFVRGDVTWGTMIALERDGDIVLGVISSPAQDRRWWAVRGEGAYSRKGEGSARRLRVSATAGIAAERITSLPALDRLSPSDREAVEDAAGGVVREVSWSQQVRVAEGEIDAAVWYCGDVWDHAAPSILVEEAGGQYSDHAGGRRLDTRTAVYSNGLVHAALLAALGRTSEPER